MKEDFVTDAEETLQLRRPFCLHVQLFIFLKMSPQVVTIWSYSGAELTLYFVVFMPYLLFFQRMDQLICI